MEEALERRKEALEEVCAPQEVAKRARCLQFEEDLWNTVKMASSRIEEAVEMSLMSSPLLGDGSWELRVLVTDLQVERTIRVKGDLHLGGVMLKLVDELGRTAT